MLIKRLSKKSLMILSIIVFFTAVILIYFNQTKQAHKAISDMENKYIEQKAISTVMAMYLNFDNYIIEECQKQAQALSAAELNMKITSAEGLTGISISGTPIVEENTAHVIVEVYEQPFKTVRFYELTYKKFNDTWLLDSIGFDA